MTLGLFAYLNLAIYAAGKVPFVAATVLKYVAFGAKPGQEDSDARTIGFVAAMKSATADGDQITVENLQKLAGRIHPCSDHTWGIYIHYDVPNGDEIEQFVDQAVLATCPDDVDRTILPKSTYSACSGEWEAPRKFKGTIADLTAQEQYNLMHEECKNKDVVVLYFHGGAHYLGNETGHRHLVRKIAKMAGGAKAFSVRYRLSPQNPFPSSLTDALAAYEYLVNPPKGALHKAVLPQNIVIAGDSAGGNMTSALMAILIESQPRWQLPGGMILLSPWADLTHSLPSCRHAPNDFLPEMHGELKSHKASEAWASDGKQRQFYAPDALLLHPLVSPIMYEKWGALGAVLIETGAEERLRDEGRYMAQHMAELGVTVQYHEYKSMPHVFQALLHTQASHISIKTMGEYILAVTTGKKIEACKVLRNGKGEEQEFGEGQFKEYVHKSLRQGMVSARSNFGQSLSATKSVL